MQPEAMIYWWSAFGRLPGRAKRLLRGPFAAFGHPLGALFFCSLHLKEVRTGNLESFERVFA